MSKNKKREGNKSDGLKIQKYIRIVCTYQLKNVAVSYAWFLAIALTLLGPKTQILEHLFAIEINGTVISSVKKRMCELFKRYSDVNNKIVCGAEHLYGRIQFSKAANNKTINITIHVVQYNRRAEEILY